MFSYDWGVLKDTDTPLYSITRQINETGTIASETRRGHTWHFHYDALDRIERVIPPTGHHTVVSRDHQNGRWMAVSRGEGPQASETTYVLDGYGRLLEAANRAGVRTRAAYDALGRKRYESAPFTGAADVGAIFQYDALGRVRRTETSDGAAVVYGYASGVDVTITYQEGRVTHHEYAAFGDPGDARLVTVVDGEGQTWGYQHNVLGRLTQVSQPEAPDRSWVYYPGTDLLQREIHPESGETTHEYDASGRLEAKTTPRGRFTFTYDANDRLCGIDAPGGSFHDVHLDYDDSDNRTLLQNGSVTSTFRFDAANRLEWRKDVISGQPERQTSYRYDDWDNIISMTYPSGRGVTYRYDPAGRIDLVYQQPGDLLVGEVLEYHPSGALKRVRLGNGIEETYDYHPQRYWPTGVSSGPLTVTYTHDRVGNIRTVADPRPGFNQQFEYDSVDRLRFVYGFGENELIACMRKLLTILNAMMRTSTTWQQNAEATA